MALHVGQKVSLVDPNPEWGDICPWSLSYPVVNVEYTVRMINEFLGETVICLAEVRNREILWDDGFIREPAWFASRFRPLTTPKSEATIAELKRLCIPSKRGVDA